MLRATIFTLQSVNYLQRIVNAINDKHRKLNNDWDQALSYASGELKRRADPLRTVDLGERTWLIGQKLILILIIFYETLQLILQQLRHSKIPQGRT